MELDGVTFAGVDFLLMSLLLSTALLLAEKTNVVDQPGVKVTFSRKSLCKPFAVFLSFCGKESQCKYCLVFRLQREVANVLAADTSFGPLFRAETLAEFLIRPSA